MQSRRVVGSVPRVQREVGSPVAVLTRGCERVKQATARIGWNKVPSTLHTHPRIAAHEGIGLGRAVRLAEAAVAGAGLVAGDELVQRTAFPNDAVGPAGGGCPAGSNAATLRGH